MITKGQSLRTKNNNESVEPGTLNFSNLKL